MNPLGSFVRSHRWLLDFARASLMYWRRWRYGLVNVHPTFYLAKGSKVSSDLLAREYSYIGPECMIGPKVELGAYAMLGPRVAIVGGDHRSDRPGTPIIFSGRPVLEPTLIETDAWVGCGAILIAGVCVGRGAIVAAGAVVTHDVPPYEIHGGVPARKIGERFAEVPDRELHERMLAGSPNRGEYCPPLEKFTPANSRRRWRVAALAVVLGAFALELLLRSLWGFGNPLLLQKDPDIGYLYRPNQHISRLGHSIAINAYHQRSGPITPEPAPGTLRILFVGDSVTFGTTLLDQRQTITELVQTRLDDDQNVEALNASAGSWGLGNQLAYLQRFGTMGARIVVFQIGSHDLLQCKSTPARVGVDPAMPDKRPLTALGEVWQRYVWPRLLGTGNTLPSAIAEGSEAESQFAKNMNFLVEAVQLVRDSGATPVILHTPDRDEVVASQDHFEQKYQSWRGQFLLVAERQRVALLNLAELWRGDSKTRQYFLDHVHLNALGTDAVAAAVCEFLRALATPAVTGRSDADAPVIVYRSSL